MRQMESRIRLEVIHGRAAIRGALADRVSIPTTLGRDGAMVWRRADHLAIRAERMKGGRLSLLAARFGTTGRDPFLLLDDAVIPAGGDRALGTSKSASEGAGEPACLHMVAALLLRLVALEDQPAALVTHTENVSLVRALRTVAAALPAAMQYPIPDSTVIRLRTAAMTHRIARTIGVPAWTERLWTEGLANRPAAPNLVTLDLRSVHEEELVPVLNRLFRARLPGTGPAMPRPRTASAG